MVKAIVILSVMLASLYAQTALFEKVRSLVGDASYQKNHSYIKIIFSPEQSYYHNGSVDVVKVAQTLKDNGLLQLFFKKPQELELSFTTNGDALYFVKIVEDALQNMGYYNYLLEDATLDNSEFVWKIKLTSEYIMDPTVFKKELSKNNAFLVNIERLALTHWRYSIDISKARLNAYKLSNNTRVNLKRSQYAYWLDVRYSRVLNISSLNRNHWYPYIAIYDRRMRLLDIVKKDKVMQRIRFTLPKDAAYVKLDDIYSMKNIKDGLQIEAR
ncbi:MAG: hypothetical protein DSZ03_05710 [Sulfurimonas sp.]|nr:MAG: hypothetical protein DSZ03_05710 [Sulfurimonas sp.]